MWWLNSRKSSAKTQSNGSRNVAFAGASPLALPTSLTPLEYYQKTAKATGIELDLNAVSRTVPNGLQPGTTQYEQFAETMGGSLTYKEFFQSTGGLFRQPWELEYAKEHYSPLPPAVRAHWESQAKVYASRYEAEYKKHPPADKFFVAPDQFSKQMLLVFRPEHTLGTSVNLKVPVSPEKTLLVDRSFAYRNWGWFPTDEFGRPYEGWGAGGGFDFLTTVSMIGNTILPYIPGYGTAANVALQATVAIAQGKSMKEVALAAARAALPPGAAYAFDIGVGLVLEGKSPKDAVVEAAITELDKKYPGARIAYEQGQSMAKQYTGKNVNGLSFGGVFL